MAFALHLLGTPKLVWDSGVLHLERKTGAVLAFLALEGQTQKYKLSGWLWADSGETTARNNMRQLLRRLRLAAGDVIEGDDRIHLHSDVTVDVQGLSGLQNPSLELLKQEAELLEGQEFDDAPDFEEWLFGAREEFRALRSRAAQIEAERLEKMGLLAQALEFALFRVKLEPLSEEAYRQVARLQYLLGERGAARVTLERCQAMLQEELGIEPLPETLELLGLIERGAVLAGTPQSKETVLPTAILRPPVLAGREREWALMEEAWQRGQIIYLEGEPGVGKSRLALDFANSKGKVFHFQARPGDAGIPFATQARAVREMIAQEPQILEQIPKWAIRELARLLPELSSEDSLPPLASENEKLRFFEAISQVIQAREAYVTVADDVQFADTATAESTGYLMTKFATSTQKNHPRIINVFRRSELLPEIEAGLNQGVEAGVLAKITLEPLEKDAIHTLLDGLGLEDSADLVQGLQRYTGGNPMFILETLKHLIETGTLAQGLPSRLTPQGKVAVLIGRRLQRLSSNALNLVRLVAVAKTSFDLQLAASVLERGAMELAEAHAELETALVLRGNAFAHDLLFEAVQSGIPQAIGQVLHAQTAAYLESRHANPALIAQHWLEGNNQAKAVPWLLAAAKNLYSGKGAAQMYAQAASIMQELGQTEAAFEARVAQTKALRDAGLGIELEAVTEVLFCTAQDPRQRALAWLCRVDRFGLLGDLQNAGEFLEQALQEAQQTEDTLLQVEVLIRLASRHFGQGQANEGIVVLGKAHRKALDSGLPEARLLTERMQCITKQMSGDWEGAQPHYTAALELAEQLQDYHSQSLLMIRAGVHHLELGDAQTALRIAEQTWKKLETYHGPLDFRNLTALVLWAAQQMLGKPYQGVSLLEQLEQEFAGYINGITGALHAAMSLGYIYLGQPDRATHHFELAKQWNNYPINALYLLQSSEALLVELGIKPFPENIEPHSSLTAVEQGIVLTTWAKILPPEAALPMIERASHLGNNREVPASIIVCQTRLAQKLLEANQPEPALNAIQAAVTQLETHYAIAMDNAEVHFTHYQVLQVLENPDAAQALAKARAWVQEVAKQQPEEYRTSYLQNKPLNKAILEAQG